MFSDIDFLSGNVKWVYDTLEEDMLQVEYPNNYVLNAGWNESQQTYDLFIFRDSSSYPVAKYVATNTENARTLLIQAIKRIDEESQKSKPYYGSLWETEIIEL